MYVHESGVGYTLYIQNNKYANQVLEERDAEASGKIIDKPYDSSLDDYLNKVIDSIPELKEYEANGGGIGVVILPESASSTLKDAVSQTTNKMLDEGTDENILKGVLGIVKFNYSGDVEYGNGIAKSKNDTFDFDLKAANDVLNKFKDIYTSNGELSSGLGKFSQYLNEIYGIMKKEADPTPSESKTTTDSTGDTKNDLVDILVEEMDKKKEGSATETEELRKNLYKKYIKSLSSNLKNGLFQQYG
ncbi:hypothetical protein [Sulfuricurvum sp.]|uniref:hypothetical protein n=2 Tax=Sulfuricurvum sp. TaxID=2025608 RepID=UPI0026077233|nr:hypothetical protein [Sulfuricurvum sp.]MDD3598077.1 hypothetical protein [Sulfuricurvum sp.]